MEVTVYKCSREICPPNDLLEYANDKILYTVNHCRGLCKLIIDDDKWDRDIDSIYKSIIDNYVLLEYEKSNLLTTLTRFKQYLEEEKRGKEEVSDMASDE